MSKLQKLKFYLWEIAACIIQTGGKRETPQDTLTANHDVLRRLSKTESRSPDRSIQAAALHAKGEHASWRLLSLKHTPHTRIDNSIIDDLASQIGIYGLGIYVAIKRHLNQKTGECFPSYQTIAKKLGLTGER